MLKTKPVKRDIRLDVLRCLAIILVLGRHTFMYLPSDRNLLANFFVVWQRYGWVGVDLFFVISGFLVSDLIFRDIKKGVFSIKRFYIRREVKIYPPFFVLIVVTVLFLTIRHHPFTWLEVVAELFFFQNYCKGLWLHTWSLAVEEHFYLLLPIIVFLLVKKERLSKLPLLLLLVMAAVLLIRVVNALTTKNYEESTMYFPTHLRIDSFVPGVLLSYLKNFNEPYFLKLLRVNKMIYFTIFLLSMIFLVTVPHMHIAMLTIGFSILSIGFLALLLLFLSINSDRFRPTFIFKCMATIGESSYQIYLWHYAVLFWIISAIVQVAHLDTRHYFVIIPLFTVISICVGLFMNKILEKPILMLREKYFPAI